MINNSWTIESRRKNAIESYQQYRQYLTTTNELWLDAGEYCFAFFILGHCYAFENGILESKKNYYKAGKVAVEFYLFYRENFYPDLIKHKCPPFSYVGSMIAVILCDNESLLKEYAQTIDYLELKEAALPVKYHFTYAMKYLFLNNFEKSKNHLQEVHHEKYFQLHFKGFSHIIKGVLENNIDLINEGLAYRLKYHKRGNPKGSLFHQYSIEATALAKLSMMYGFEPDVSSPFIHKGLLEKTEGIVYEGIEEITDALEEANRKAGSLWGKIGKWLE